MDNPEQNKKLKQFLLSGKKIEFKRKETVLSTYTGPEWSSYWIISGYVKVCSYTNNGNERILFIYGPNDLFPIGWSFERSQQYVTFIALNSLSVVAKSFNDFRYYISKEPFLLTEIARMQSNLTDRIYILNVDNAFDRVAHSILTLAHRFGQRNGLHTIINLPLSQQEFADLVRLSRETAGKILNQLEDREYIILGRRHIMVDTDKLEKVLEH